MWTYDPALGTSADKVRFLIGDTVQGDPLIEDDEEIAFCLSECGNNIYRAGAFALRRASAKLVRELNLISPVAESNALEQSKQLLKLAQDLEDEATRLGGGAKVFAGGISIADRDSRNADTDRVTPSFTAGTNSVTNPVTDWSA